MISKAINNGQGQQLIRLIQVVMMTDSCPQRAWGTTAPNNKECHVYGGREGVVVDGGKVECRFELLHCFQATVHVLYICLQIMK